MNQNATEPGESPEAGPNPSPGGADGSSPVTVSSPAAAGAAPAVSDQVAVIERERWLRDRFDKEHQVTLAMMRLLVAGVTGEGRVMRFWRWLIDDLRSERRLLADPSPERNEESMLLARILSWFRGAGHSAKSDGTPNSGRVG